MPFMNPMPNSWANRLGVSGFQGQPNQGYPSVRKPQAPLSTMQRAQPTAAQAPQMPVPRFQGTGAGVSGFQGQPNQNPLQLDPETLQRLMLLMSAMRRY